MPIKVILQISDDFNEDLYCEFRKRDELSDQIKAQLYYNHLPPENLSIEASGKELEKIRNRFHNVPFGPSRDSQVWRGEMAWFILRNWED